MHKLWEKETPYFDKEIGQEEPGLIPFLIEDGKEHPCIIVFPGGGYSCRADDYEGVPVAKWLNTLGISAFVIKYRIAPYGRKAILNDALRGIRYVRYHAEKFRVIPDKIGVLGFSAGGHLACMTAVRHMDAELFATDPIDAVSSRPDLAVLCYPVVSFVEHGHNGSAIRFLKDEDTWEMRQKYSGEKNVTEETPPMFIWHTVADGGVPVENSINLARALRKNRVSFAMHLYPNGGHGECFAKNISQACMWTEDCSAWLAETFEMEVMG